MVCVCARESAEWERKTLHNVHSALHDAHTLNLEPVNGIFFRKQTIVFLFNGKIEKCMQMQKYKQRNY